MIKILKNLTPYKWVVLAVVLLVFGQSIAELFLPTLMADIMPMCRKTWCVLFKGRQWKKGCRFRSIRS